MLHVFIVNSFAGNGNFSENIREELSGKEGFEYLIFNSEYQGHESILAGRIYDLFEDEKIRFYACGGSGTFRNIMKGLPSLDRVELAEIPYGHSNDFLEVFGRNRNLFTLDNLINGKVVKFDYIDSNLGPVHNSITTGISSKIIRLIDQNNKMHFMFGHISYMLAGIVSIFSKTYYKAHIVTDTEEFDTVLEQASISNGCKIGGVFRIEGSNSPKDGLINLRVFERRNTLIKLLYFISAGYDATRLSSKSIAREIRSVELTRLDGQPFEGDFDGELEVGQVLKAHVVKHGMNYVIPRDIDI